MNRRLPNTRPAPSLEGRDPDARTPCDGHYPLFWALIDHPANRWNASEAADLCGTCPIRDRCLSDNRERGEDWAKSVTVELVRRTKRKVAA